MLKKIVLFLMCVAVMVPACDKRPVTIRVSEPIKTIAQGQSKQSLNSELVRLKEQIAKLQLAELEQHNSWLLSFDSAILRGVLRIVELVPPVITAWYIYKLYSK